MTDKVYIKETETLMSTTAAGTDVPVHSFIGPFNSIAAAADQIALMCNNTVSEDRYEIWEMPDDQ